MKQYLFDLSMDPIYNKSVVMPTALYIHHFADFLNKLLVLVRDNSAFVQYLTSYTSGTINDHTIEEARNVIYLISSN